MASRQIPPQLVICEYPDIYTLYSFLMTQPGKQGELSILFLTSQKGWVPPKYNIFVMGLSKIIGRKVALMIADCDQKIGDLALGRSRRCDKI